MILVAFAEVISISAIMPFLTILISPNVLFDHPLMRSIFEQAGFNQANELLFPITIIFIIVVFIANGMRMFLYWFQLHLAHEIGAEFSARIFSHTLFQSYEYHLQNNSSESIANIMNKSDAIVGQAILPLMVIISSSIILVAIIGTLIFVNPTLVISCLVVFGCIYLLIAVYFRMHIDKQSKIINYNGPRLIKVIQESIGGIRDILIEHSQEVYCSAFKKIDKPYKYAHAAVLSMIGMPRFVIEGVGVILIAILAYYLIRNDPLNSMVVPTLGIMALGSQRLLPVMQQGYASWSAIRAGKPALGDIITLLKNPATEYIAYESEKLNPIIFNSEIKIDNVSFSYKVNNIDVLKNISVTIPKGARIGIIGTTGSGKSTLLDIIMGLIFPSDGKIFVDKISLSKKNILNWRARIAHVPQHVYIADASVAENIAFGVLSSRIDLDRVKLAAKKAQIAQTIEEWDDGYQTIVGERGARLSGGQRQRIGIARALYKEAQVIIFDEATSALDNATELAVMNTLSNLDSKLTIIMVAHRLSTLESCDRIVQLVNGLVKNILSYKELITKTSEEK